MKYGKRFYASQSILGKLYRNAAAYKQGDIDRLNRRFSSLNVNDNQLQNVPRPALSSLVKHKTILSFVQIFIIHLF